MKTPLLIVNFKTYKAASGEHALDIAYKCERVAKSTDTNIAIAPQNADIGRIAEKVEIPVIAQHTDPEGYGSNTGSDIIETLAHNGADGTLINHSEDQVSLDTIEAVVKRCRKQDITSVVCVDEETLAESVKDFKPDFIAYEPPELIGGDVSVSQAKPEILEGVVDTVGRAAPVLTGAGVKTAEDVEKALELGSEGILVASGVIKADDVEQALRDLVEPF
ncbi:MAG: triose-phosphate isomerase [Candidatus Nanohaloarchaea archaeon]|nr:triose-phosphate isomerase [Candidatus Nanohaloarchaea archaeon]